MLKNAKQPGRFGGIAAVPKGFYRWDPAPVAGGREGATTTPPPPPCGPLPVVGLRAPTNTGEEARILAFTPLRRRRWRSKTQEVEQYNAISLLQTLTLRT